ncbi:MAG: hypothetical protein ACLPT4_15660 [Verrucomicrobiia bacterium]
MKPTRIVVFVLLVLIGVGIVLAQEVFTNPTTPSIQVVGTNVVLSTSFLTVPGWGYQGQLLYSDSPSLPSSNGWFNAGNPILGTGGTATWSYTDVGAASLTQQYYWIRIEILS